MGPTDGQAPESQRLGRPVRPGPGSTRSRAVQTGRGGRSPRIAAAAAARIAAAAAAAEVAGEIVRAVRPRGSGTGPSLLDAVPAVPASDCVATPSTESRAAGRPGGAPRASGLAKGVGRSCAPSRVVSSASRHQKGCHSARQTRPGRPGPADSARQTRPGRPWDPSRGLGGDSASPGPRLGSVPRTRCPAWPPRGERAGAAPSESDSPRSGLSGSA